MSDKKTRIALVGCGGISRHHFSAIQTLPNLEMAACADIDPDRAKSACESYNIDKHFTDWQEMVNDIRPDILLFATWPSQHLEQITTAAALGVPAILCEKALALTADEGHAMADACRKNDILLMEAFMYRHAPRTQTFLERVRSGEIGDIRFARAAFSSCSYNPKGDNWRNRKETGGGIAFDFTCYCVNILRAIMNRPPIRVGALAETCPEQDIIISLDALLDYGDGITALVESSQKETFRAEVEVVGNRGTLALPLFLMNTNSQSPPPIRLTRGNMFQGNWNETEIPTSFNNPYALQVANLAAALESGTALNMPLEETLDNLTTMDAMIHASKTGQFEKVQA